MLVIICLFVCSSIHIALSMCGDRFTEGLTAIKSIVIASSTSPLHFHIFILEEDKHNIAEIESKVSQCGHSIVVLSRRPGQIREILHIEKPLAERDNGDPELDRYQKQLWALLRNEARAADAELING